MQKTTVLEISKMKMIPNRVVVKLTRKEDELDLGSGKKIFIDPSFARECHSPTVGIVVNFSKEINHTLMPWRTVQQLKIGDYAIFSYESSINALAEDVSRVLMDEKKDLYIIIDLEDIFVVKRGVEVIPVNGYVLCKPVEQTIKSSIIIPDQAKKKRSDKLAEVVHVGIRNSAYYLGDGTERFDLYDTEVPIKKGDVILFDKFADLPIEYEIHQSLGSRKETFFRIQRCYIKCIIT